MKNSIYIGRVMGWYFVIFGLVILLRHQVMHAAILQIATQPALLFFVAINTLIIGLLLVVAHNVWVRGWQVVITILSWLILIGGLVRVSMPEIAIKGAEWWIHNPTYLTVVAAIYVILGVFLLYKSRCTD